MPDVGSVARRLAHVILVHQVVHAVALVVEWKIRIILVTGQVLNMEQRASGGVLWWSALVVARTARRYDPVLPASCDGPV